MKKFLFLLLVLSLPLSTYAQCNEKTKTMVEELKKSITYPKYNIGDTLYIAFINNVDADINSLSDKDIDVNRVVIEIYFAHKYKKLPIMIINTCCKNSYYYY